MFLDHKKQFDLRLARSFRFDLELLRLLITSGVSALAFDLGDVPGFATVLAAVLAERAVFRDGAQAGGMGAFVHSSHL